MIISQSPGRINIIGEHTDYNNGFVLPAAIDKKTVVKLEANGDPLRCRVTAGNLQETFEFKLDDFQPLASGWQNYIMGVVHELQKLGGKISGFNCEFEGNVPIGGGMSSSAALECSLAFALNKQFDLGFTQWEIIKACQMAEHNFVGIKCGIMDMFASTMGKKNQVMLLDCRSLDFQYFPFDLGAYQLLLLNTNVSHALASSEYNTRRAECEAGVAILQQKFPDIQSLRDATMVNLEAVKEELTENIYKRCHHVISENSRVEEATQALLAKDHQTLGELIYQSHYSLQHDYEVSCPELDFLVQQTLDKDYILGSRMMGGGFGGCTLNVIHSDQVDAFIELASKNYEEKFNLKLTPYQVSIENGTSLI